jgi:hypothetical protein
VFVGSESRTISIFGAPLEDVLVGEVERLADRLAPAHERRDRGAA